MYKLTEQRLRRAEEILEKYHDQLYSNGEFDCLRLELELRKCWDLGYRNLKGIIIDLSKMDRYKFLAAYYMENNPGAVVTEFQKSLANLYGIDWYHADNLEEKKAAFWNKFRTTFAAKN